MVNAARSPPRDFNSASAHSSRAAPILVLRAQHGPEVGRFLLQVDRQTKRSYETAEAAETAGMVIKKGHPIVRVSVYDSVETANKIIELPAGSSPTS